VTTFLTTLFLGEASVEHVLDVRRPPRAGAARRGDALGRQAGWYLRILQVHPSYQAGATQGRPRREVRQSEDPSPGNRGFERIEHDWQGKTFIDSLRLLLPAAGELPGLTEGLVELQKLLPPQPA
jgi:hypothetical protein